MSEAYKKLKVNPFEKDVVTEPREVTFSVSGLNDDIVASFLEKFERLEAGPLPRPQIAPEKIQLLTSPESGYGKSHMLGKLFNALGVRATQIYLRCFEDAGSPWQSILQATVQELLMPDRKEQNKFFQLEVFSTGVLAHLAAVYVEGEEPNSDRSTETRRIAETLKSNPLEIFYLAENNREWAEWLKSRINDSTEIIKLVHFLRLHTIDLQGKEQAWLKVLCGYAFGTELQREAALKWLRAESLEEDNLKCLSLAASDNEVRADASAQESNAICFKRLKGLCTLASYYRPFLFCFDQIEGFSGDKQRIRVFSNCLEKLYAEVKNHLTIVATNSVIWANDIAIHIEKPQLERIAVTSPLRGINQTGADELIRNRLGEFQLSTADIDAFFDEHWLDGVYKDLSQLGVRTLLQKASKRFVELQQGKIRPLHTLPEFFTIQVNELKTKPASQLYNGDVLMWFTQTLVTGYMGTTVTRTGNKYFSTQWVWPDRSIFFAYEAGDNCSRWQAMTKESLQILTGEGGKFARSYVLRTPELKAIPRPSWDAIKKIVNDAKSRGFEIYVLTKDEVCQIHAARDLHSNALQGNIPYTGPVALEWLKKHFEPFFNRLAHGKTRVPPVVISGGGKNGTGTIPPVGPPKTGLTPRQEASVIEFVKKGKLVDVKNILKHLSDSNLEPAVLRTVENHPNLKAHPGPQTIYIQWRITT